MDLGLATSGGTTIRPATRGDVEGLADLERRTFATDRLSRRALAYHVENLSAALLVAKGAEDQDIESQGIQGYALLLLRRRSPKARLYSIAVGRRGRGIGRRLLAACEALAARRGKDGITLEVRVDNAAAVRLYEAAGYRLFGRHEAYYADGAAALRYGKALPQPIAAA